MAGLKTLLEAQEYFTQGGITIASWANEHGFNYQDVIQVLHGRTKGKYGAAHKIAVALGLKSVPIENTKK